MSAEAWRPIPRFRGYEASSLGRIRSWRKLGRYGGTATQPRILTQHSNRYDKYLAVDMTEAGKTTRVRVHRLVGEAFYGPLPAGLETRHLDGDSRNNRADNLRYGTKAENVEDIRNHGNYWSKRTHCGQGHRYTASNTGRKSNGGRQCRRCAVRNAIAWQSRELAKAEADGVVTPHLIRQWARGQGFEVAETGRLRDELKTAFVEAQREMRAAS